MLKEPEKEAFGFLLLQLCNSLGIFLPVNKAEMAEKEGEVPAGTAHRRGKVSGQNHGLCHTTTAHSWSPFCPGSMTYFDIVESIDSMKRHTASA